MSAAAGTAAVAGAAADIVHLRCGDDILHKLAQAGLPGRFRRWADALCQGPTPGGLTPSQWRAVRTRFLADAYGLDQHEAAARLARDDAALIEAAAATEIVLWFEHDLFDQTVLIYLLHFLAQRGVAADRLSLICIDRHAAVPRFIGLGQLAPAQLADLFPARRAVTSAQLRLASAAWHTYTAPEPAPLMRLLAQDTSALPYLGPALRRHLQEFPARGSGLSLTERLALQAVRDGASTGGAIFTAVQTAEATPFMGDIMLYAVLKRLACGPAPLLKADRPWPPGLNLADHRFRLTDQGARVLDGEADWIALAGIDRWVGGVHLTGSSPWRWDDGAGMVVTLQPQQGLDR